MPDISPPGIPPNAAPPGPASPPSGQSVLVCGGAGYIGSHMARLLAQSGHTPILFDNLSTGHLEVLDSLTHAGRADTGPRVEFVRGDLLDRQSLRRVFAEYEIDAVMHFAAHIEVGESVAAPGKYYQNNVAGALDLMQAMVEFQVNRLIFSSTAAVYGQPLPGVERLTEEHPRQPVNPYGRTKLMVETMLADFAAAHGLRSMSLRYFNAAGAHPDADLGEAHYPESHLIPNVLLAALGKRELTVFGNDYPTPDGTCVRDYIHVNDLCAAHLKALDFLARQEIPGAFACNLGNGRGFSVLEVIRAAAEVTKTDIAYRLEPPRPGDAPFLVADASLAHKLLDWQPRYTSLNEIIATAWDWHRAPRY